MGGKSLKAAAFNRSKSSDIPYLSGYTLGDLERKLKKM